MKMKISIAGLGLIGGSFEKASLKAGHEIVPLEKAELVLVCLPPDVIVPWIAEHRGTFAAGEESRILVRCSEGTGKTGRGTAAGFPRDVLESRRSQPLGG